MDYFVFLIFHKCIHKTKHLRLDILSSAGIFFCRNRPLLSVKLKSSLRTTSGAGTATSQEHLNSLPIFSGARVTRILVLCVILCRSLFVLFLLIIVLSSIYGFWLPLWYLHTLLIDLANWRYDIKKHYIIHILLTNRNYIPAAKMAAADHLAFNSPRESQIIIIIVLFPECLSKHLTFLH